MTTKTLHKDVQKSVNEFKRNITTDYLEPVWLDIDSELNILFSLEIKFNLKGQIHELNR